MLLQQHAVGRNMPATPVTLLLLLDFAEFLASALSLGQQRNGP